MGCSSWFSPNKLNTAPTPRSEASVCKMKAFLKSGLFTTGAEHRSLFRVWNAASHCFVQTRQLMLTFCEINQGAGDSRILRFTFPVISCQCKKYVYLLLCCRCWKCLHCLQIGKVWLHNSISNNVLKVAALLHCKLTFLWLSRVWLQKVPQDGYVE